MFNISLYNSLEDPGTHIIVALLSQLGGACRLPSFPPWRLPGFIVIPVIRERIYMRTIMHRRKIVAVVDPNGTKREGQRLSFDLGESNSKLAPGESDAAACLPLLVLSTPIHARNSRSRDHAARRSACCARIAGEEKDVVRRENRSVWVLAARERFHWQMETCTFGICQWTVTRLEHHARHHAFDRVYSQ